MKDANEAEKNRERMVLDVGGGQMQEGTFVSRQEAEKAPALGRAGLRKALSR